MYTRVLALLAVLVVGLGGSAALADCGCGAVVTAYAPVYAPVVPAYTAYYAPPVAYAAPVPYVSYYAPVTPYVSYYAPYATYYAPPVAVRYAVPYGVVAPSAYGTPKIYVPGEPVRNVWRAITP